MSQIKPNECSYIWTSLSAYCAENLTDFRNGPYKEGSDKKDKTACFSNCVRRLVAEPLYLVNAVLALVEAVVRLPLAMIAALFKLAMCCDFSSKRSDGICERMYYGSAASFETAVFCIVALAYNICSRDIKTKEFCCHAVPLKVVK